MVPWGCLRFVIVVFPDHTDLLFLVKINSGAGYDGLAASIMEYCRESISMCEYNYGLPASTNRLTTGEDLNAPKANLRSWLYIGIGMCRYNFLAEPYTIQPWSNFDLTKNQKSFCCIVWSATHEVCDKTDCKCKS